MDFLSITTNQIFFPGLRQVHPSIPFDPYPLSKNSATVDNSNDINPQARRKHKVIFILGPTGTGKSKLAIDLAIYFNGEVVNSDKIQVYSGLHIITNKVTPQESAGIPHHLIGVVHPDADYPASAFRQSATKCIDSIIARGRLPIVAGGSNSYIEELVNGDGGNLRRKYDCCFIWVDVDLQVLQGFVSIRVDKMVEMGLVEEARGVFDLEADYSKGIRKAIGVPEMDRYLRAELDAGKVVNEDGMRRLLDEAVAEIKENTCKLTWRQLEKIRRLAGMWDVKRVDATEAFVNELGREEVWSNVAKKPSIDIVEKFLREGSRD